MIQKGDSVIFLNGSDSTVYIAKTDTYEHNGVYVVDLKNNSLNDELRLKAVDIKHLGKLQHLFTEDFS